MDYVEKIKNNSCSIVHARIDVTRISSSFYIRFDRFIPYKYVNLFSFAPRCLKKRGSYISSMNVNEEIFGDESGWISRRGGGKRKTFSRFFFSFSFRTRPLTGFLAGAKRSYRDFLHSGPRFAIHRFDTVARNTRYIPPPGIDGKEHYEGTRGYAVALTHVYTYDFSIGPRDIFPSLRLPLPPPALPLERRALLLAILFPIGRDAIPRF